MFKTLFIVEKSILSQTQNLQWERPSVTFWITKQCIDNQKSCRFTILSNISVKQRSIKRKEMQSLSSDRFRIHKEQLSFLLSSKGIYSKLLEHSQPLRAHPIKRNARGFLLGPQLQGPTLGQPKIRLNSKQMSTVSSSSKNTRRSSRKST